METIQSINWILFGQAGLPLLILTFGGLMSLLLSVFPKKISGTTLVTLSLVITGATFALAWGQWLGGMSLTLKMFYFDRLSYAFDLIFLLALFLTLLISRDYLREEGRERGEYYSLLFFSTVGLMLIAHGEDLILIFLGVEIASLAAYILAGFRCGFLKSYEASLKYFILGSFASGFLLYGIALAYGAVGSTSLTDLAAYAGILSSRDPLLLSLAIAFLLIGIGFKIAAVPFHFWSPDVYEGAPTPITAFMASGIKTGGFVVLVRIILALGHLPEIPWVPVIWVLAALTMTVGNLMALRQTNIKRMLAYSSIAHAGYLLVGMAAAAKDHTLTESTLGAVIFYLFAYSMMTIGAFTVVLALGRRESGGHSSDKEDGQELASFAGLGEREPVLAAMMTLFMLSLVGIPPMIGFVGKFYLFSGAIQAGLVGLVVVAVLNSTVSVFYYLAPVMKMYFQSGTGGPVRPLTTPLLVALVICLFAVTYLGLLPSDLFLIARESVRELVF